ncbi:hypothetical protein GCM10008018_63440 [Paenibacillus marchantiophytorum]|uniref:CdiI immunity protein domain-containing protein n=1 Tax=Paenibacillus marchantiophytorum TaxID=1619310 RepID=A0ABQ1FGA0_9BACL|nr:hypothetical protein [Paenibacillus marchantiophytorum]GGA09091.1 hypothetical protein GCM10008018_63440 [Paenibacillus marchantiophytorum]
MNESLMDTFKRYYADYRSAANVDESFADAYHAISYHVINQTEQLANQGNLDDIQQLIREFREFRFSEGSSTDALKEHFEQELVQKVLDR